MLTEARTTEHKIVTAEEWLTARKRLLEKEKELTRLHDQLSAERRTLPWVKIKKPYVFEGPEGKHTLSDLFQGRSQLIVYHFMYGPHWAEGCPSCSFLGKICKSAAARARAGDDRATSGPVPLRRTGPGRRRSRDSSRSA